MQSIFWTALFWLYIIICVPAFLCSGIISISSGINKVAWFWLILILITDFFFFLPFLRLCHYSTCDLCWDGGDASTAAGWIGECVECGINFSFLLILLCWLMLFSHSCSSLTQVINYKGSYSFLVCGVIFGCMGFTIFLWLLIVHHVYKKNRTGTLIFLCFTQWCTFFVHWVIHGPHIKQSNQPRTKITFYT